MSVPSLELIVAALDEAGIPHMLTGSFASSHHGAPRATQDIDLVIAPTPEALRRLAGLLPSETWYYDVDAALAALGRWSQFNVLHHESGWKFDLIIRKPRAFSEAEFARRIPVELSGIDLHVATAEDVIIAKLEWARRGGSRRQLEDVAALLRARAGTLDRAWIERWVIELGLRAEWREAEALAS